MSELNIKDILNEIGYTNLVNCGDYYRTKPLYRNSKNITSLSIHKTTGYWKDFGSEQSGNLEQLVKLTNGQDVYFGKFKKESVERLEEKHLSPSDKMIWKYLNNDYSYWKKRGAKEEHLRKLKSGVFPYDGKFRKRYVFPIYNYYGFIVGYSGRSLHKNQTMEKYNIPKWKHLGNVSEWDYPYYFIKKRLIDAESIILVESIGDMLALFSCEIYNVLVCFGLNVQSGVLKILLSRKLKNITIAFNNDDRCNGLIGAAKAKNNLHNYFDQKTVNICLPTEKNDFGDMTKSEIKKWHKNSLTFWQ